MDNRESETADASQTAATERFQSLSWRILALIIVVIMAVEVLIYIPSIGRFWQSHMEDALEHGYLTATAAEVLGQSELDAGQRKKLLNTAGIYSVALRRRGGQSVKVAAAAAPKADAAFDLRSSGLPASVAAGLAAMWHGENRILRVTGARGGEDPATVEVIIDEAPVGRALLGFSVRILALSVLISSFTAGFMFLSLRRLIIQPLQRITERIARFRENPEAPPSAPRVRTMRADEIGTAERELLRMQDEFRLALRQRTRLAALGAAMAKINHSLRNTLTTAMMASDVLSAIPDPDVKRITQRLASAVQRAVMLCNSTLNFASDAEMPFNPKPLKLRKLVDEVFAMARESGDNPLDETAQSAAQPAVQTAAPAAFTTINKVEQAFRLEADRDQIFRALFNLTENAVQAGAGRIEIDAIPQKDFIEITVRDNGPGLNPNLRKRMFEPLFDINRKGGAGLGLVIVQDAARAHRGSVEVAETSPSGTIFALKIPRTL